MVGHICWWAYTWEVKGVSGRDGLTHGLRYTPMTYDIFHLLEKQTRHRGFLSLNFNLGAIPLLDFVLF